MIGDALAAERDRLAELVPGFSTHDGFNARMIEWCFRSLRPFVEGADRCLEMGCSDGRQTALLADVVGRLTAVDGSAAYVEAVRAALPAVEVVHALFEEYEAPEPFDVAVLGHVLEHVDDPVTVLGRARAAVRPGGRVIATVPNGDSLHRQIGELMGMLAHRQELNASDLRIGHRRVYVRSELVADVEAAGLAVEHVGGVYLKPLSDAQMEAFPAPLAEAFYELGARLPEVCANLLVVARR